MPNPEYDPAEVVRLLSNGPRGIEAWDDLRRKFFRIEISHADLSGANLQGFDLSNCLFDRVNLSNANLAGAFLFNSQFDGSDFSGANLKGAELGDSSFNYTNLTTAVFEIDQLQLVSLKGANLQGIDFSNSDVSGFDF